MFLSGLRHVLTWPFAQRLTYVPVPKDRPIAAHRMMDHFDCPQPLGQPPSVADLSHGQPPR